MKDEIISAASIKEHLAIVILAYADYESLELSLATHAKFSVQENIPIYILQNGRGTYDTERTYSVGKRYQTLYPNQITVIDHIPPQSPFRSIQQLLSDDLEAYEYIIKLDDDIMVLTSDWIDKLINCYVNAREIAGDNLAYVTSLVNNNPTGFKILIDHEAELASEYYEKLARPHLVGNSPDDGLNPYQIVSKDVIYDGGFGTIWRLPYIARWLHKNTTMQPERYISMAQKLGFAEIDARKRYSINCMLFKKTLWEAIFDGGDDDELMAHKYCLFNGAKIYADFSVPMVHLSFYTQRDEIRDLIPQIRDVYTRFLSLPFPIPACGDRLIEIENRLRFLETKRKNTAAAVVTKGLFFSRKFRGLLRCYAENGFKYTMKKCYTYLMGQAH